MSAIELTIAPRSRPVGSGKVERLLPVRQRRMVGPFIFCDHIGPDELPPGTGIDVPSHPHIGLSTLTYLFDGSMIHRDSLGSVQTIEPGAVNWMTAGQGIAHTERSGDRTTDRTMHGLQLWVALPHDTEDGPASFDHQPATAIPSADLDGVRVRLMAGTGYGLRSPVPVSSPLVLAELRLDGAGTVVFLGGEPVGPRYIWWNFVHSDRDVIEQAKADWTAQRFPIVPGDQDGWVPLPGA